MNIKKISNITDILGSLAKKQTFKFNWKNKVVNVNPYFSTGLEVVGIMLMILALL